MNQVIYPDGTKEPVTDELLEHGSELQRANVPLTYLRLVVRKPREYKGTMGVTSVLNGHRYNYLKYKTVPDFDLAGSAFMALGISSHNMLDDNTAAKDVSEQVLEDGPVNGRSDLLELEGEMNILTDYKVSGSFKVAQAMGIVEGPKRPMLDEFGQPVLYKSNGKNWKKGDPRMEKTYIIDPSQADNWENEMQLNKYRIMYQKQGIKIDLMQNFFIVRDGGTHVAEGRGVLQNIYRCPVKTLPDEEVEKFYSTKTAEFDKIMKALIDVKGTPEEVADQTMASGVSVPLCSERECWGGRRCEKYCSYSAACKLFGDNPYLGKGE